MLQRILLGCHGIKVETNIKTGENGRNSQISENSVYIPQKLTDQRKKAWKIRK